MPAADSRLESDRSPAIQRGFAAFEEQRLYLRPLGRLIGSAARTALAAGQAIVIGRPGEAASMVEIIARAPPPRPSPAIAGEGVSEPSPACGGGLGGGSSTLILPAADFLARVDDLPQLARLAERLATPRAPWAGLSLDRPLVMGIVNVTPDSFSDGGRFYDTERAVAHGRALLAAGADLLDVGGESTRPGAAPVAPEEEAARVVPVIRALAEAGAVISVDTRRTLVMQAALDAGARIVNDVTALGDEGALELVAARRAPVALMHMQGEPQTMQHEPRYDCAPLDVYDYLEGRIAACEAAGLARADIMVDPGIGFGKNLAHNVAIMAALGLYRATGCGVFLGVSRKSFIGRLAGVTAPEARVAGSLAAAVAGVAAGADLLRVHDVAETVQALRVASALELAAEWG